MWTRPQAQGRRTSERDDDFGEGDRGGADGGDRLGRLSAPYGYDTGIIYGACCRISDDFGIGSGWEQVIAASILLGAVIGALIGSQLSERQGRHRTTLIVASVYVVGALACSISPGPVTLSLSRVLLGFAVGGATQIVPMYVAELAPAKHRGRLVLTFQVGIGVGIVISTLVGASEQFPWRVSSGWPPSLRSSCCCS